MAVYLIINRVKSAYRPRISLPDNTINRNTMSTFNLKSMSMRIIVFLNCSVLVYYLNCKKINTVNEVHVCTNKKEYLVDGLNWLIDWFKVAERRVPINRPPPDVIQPNRVPTTAASSSRTDRSTKGAITSPTAAAQ
jgi:hypothetical protein